MSKQTNFGIHSCKVLKKYKSHTLSFLYSFRNETTLDFGNDQSGPRTSTPSLDRLETTLDCGSEEGEPRSAPPLDCVLPSPNGSTRLRSGTGRTFFLNRDFGKKKKTEMREKSAEAWQFIDIFIIIFLCCLCTLPNLLVPPTVII